MSTTTQPPITIARRKVYRSRFATGPGAAWRWIYDVTGHAGPALEGLDRLSIARRKAREVANGRPVVEAWPRGEVAAAAEPQREAA